jgi:hypothetical protein
MRDIHDRLSIGLPELIGRLELRLDRQGVGLRLRLPVRHCLNGTHPLGELVERLTLRVDFGGFTLDDRLGVCKGIEYVSAEYRDERRVGISAVPHDYGGR